MPPTEFQQKLTAYTTGGLVCLAISLGKKLGLLEALDKVSSFSKPATPKQVAEEANCSERYVKEWLAFLACSDILEVNSEEQFWIDDEKKKDLITDPYPPFVKMQLVPLFAEPINKIREAFSNDHPRMGLEYEDFAEFYGIMTNITRAMHENALIPKLLPDVGNDIKQKLESESMKCLDVGCGHGFHSQMLATHFPKSDFTGLDISAVALETANANKEKEGLTNLNYVHSDASAMPFQENTFDFVTIFDACHDQRRPDLCIKEIYRVLKPGGVFAMVEVNGTSNIYKDKQNEGLAATLFYGFSLFHCLPVSSNAPGALCLGAKWGTERGRKLLSECGFNDVKIMPTEYYPLNCLYVCKK